MIIGEISTDPHLCNVADHNFLSRMSTVIHDGDIAFVKRQYLQQIPVRHFRWPETLALIQSSLWESVCPRTTRSENRCLLPIYINTDLATDTVS